MQLKTETQGRYSGFAPKSLDEIHRAHKERREAARRRAYRPPLAIPYKTARSPVETKRRKPDYMQYLTPSWVLEPTSFLEHVQAYRDYQADIANASLCEVSADFCVISDFKKLCPFDYIEVISDRRHQKAVVWRQALMEALRRYTLLSTPNIGRRVGRRDHTTVLHAINVVTRAKEQNKVTAHTGEYGTVFYVRDHG